MMTRFLPCRVFALVLAAAVLWNAPAPAQTTEASADSVEQRRWLLLCCGLPGDQGHRERLTRACRQIIQAAEPGLMVAPERRVVLVGDEPMRESLSDVTSDVTRAPGICTKESVPAAIEWLRENLDAEDAVWVIVLGHSHLYGSSIQFNVSGPDFDQQQFGAWMKDLPCREQVCWLTMPLSGFWIGPLAGKDRVILTATEADLEFTGTEMPYALADLLAGEGEYAAVTDVDDDGVASLFDLYVSTCLEIHARFQALERLQTEHGQLEDNGDGRGSEVQQSFIPQEVDEPTDTDPTDPDSGEEAKDEGESPGDSEAQGSSGATTDGEPGEEPDERATSPIRGLDGYAARQIRINLPSPTDDDDG